MSDCSDLQSQLNSIAAKLDRMNADRSNLNTEIDKLKGEIIRLNQAISGANSKADNALSQINPLQTKAAQAYELGLSNQGEIGSIAAELAALAASAAAAVALARAAMAWIGGIGASLAGLVPFIPAIVAGIGALAAAAATVAALQARLDAIERYADSIAVAATNAGSTAIAALGVGSKAERLAIAAQVAAANAQEFANRAWQRASLALDRAFTAQESADRADKKADFAIGTANTAKRRADDAIASATTANTKADTAIGTATTANTKADSAIGTANVAKKRADDAIASATTANQKADGAIALGNKAIATGNKAISIAQPLPPQIEDLKRRLGALVPSGAGTGAGTTPITSQVATAQATATSAQNTATSAAAGVATTTGAIRVIKSQIAQLQTSVFGTVIDLKPSAPGVYDTPVYPTDAPIVQVKQNTQKLVEIEKRLTTNNNNQNNNNNENKRAIAILTNLQQQCCNKEQEMQTTTITVPQFIKCGENGQPPTISAVTIRVPKGSEDATKLQFAQNTQIMVNQCQKCSEPIASVPEWWQLRPEAKRKQAVLIMRETKADGTLGGDYYSITIPHFKESTAPNTPPLADYEKGNFQGLLTLKDNSKLIVNCKTEAEAERVIGILKQFIEPAQLEGSSVKIAEFKNFGFKQIKVKAWRLDYYPSGAATKKPAWLKAYQ